MARSYSQKTIKILFGLSGNRCAFPGCNVPLIDVNPGDPDPLVLGQICHNIGSSSSGPRGTSDLSESERDSHENLLLLCPNHHKLIDARPENYPVETLRQWKAQVEARAVVDSERNEASAPLSKSELKTLEQLGNQLDALTRRAIERSERIDDDIGSSARSDVRLSAALYVRREIQEGLSSRLEARESLARPILIVGEPGVGKTSLLWSTVVDAQSWRRKAWLIDANSFVSLFEEGRSPSFSIEEFARVCEQSVFAEAVPILAIDTADVSLSSSMTSDRFTELLAYLQGTKVQLLVASRPQQGEELAFLNPEIEQLGDYTDQEFESAVLSYAQAYTGDRAPARSHAIVDELRAAVAQGFPIREVAMKPLALRMLFSIYAPDDINHTEIDIVGLYREFWCRRVQDDIRAGSPVARDEQNDLSDAACLVGMRMLVAGSPEIAIGLARDACHLAGINVAAVDALMTRGVLQSTGIGRDQNISFFHQTFFEHAAAEAIARARDPHLLVRLYAQFCETSGNQFLGAVLERALVLAEAGTPEVDKVAHSISLELLRGDEPLLSAGIYAFAHRIRSGSDLEDAVRTKISEGHKPTIERLISAAPNMGTEKQRRAIALLGKAIEEGEHRTNERIFKLFNRCANRHSDEIAKAIKDSELTDQFKSDPRGTVQARMLFYDFAESLASNDSDWVFEELGDLAKSALLRLAGEQDFRQACRVVEALAARFPQHASTFVQEILSVCTEHSELSAGVAETDALSGVLLKVDDASADHFLNCAMECLNSIENEFIVRAYLTAAAQAVPIDEAHAVRSLIEQCSASDDKSLWHAFGSTTLPLIFERFGSLPESARVTQERAACHTITEQSGDARTLLSNSLLRSEGLPPGRLSDVAKLLLEDTARAWEPKQVLFPRIVSAAAQGDIDARSSLQKQIDKGVQPQTARKLLIQIRQSEYGFSSLSPFSLRLALASASRADATIALLEKAEALDPDWTQDLEEVERLALALLKLGDDVSRTRAGKLTQHLARLTAHSPLSWDETYSRAVNDKNEAVRSAFCGAARHLLNADHSMLERRLHQILGAGQPVGEAARAEIFGGISMALRSSPELCLQYFDRFFEAVFQSPPASNSLVTLAAPMYTLEEHNWASLPEVAEKLVVNTKELSSKASHRMYRIFAKLYLRVGTNAGSDWCLRLLRLVPELHPEVARLVLPLAQLLTSSEFRQIIEYYSKSPNIPGGTLAKIDELRVSKERTTGVSVPEELLHEYIAGVRENSA